MAEYILLQGKAKWFKAHAPNKFGNWSHDLYLTPESLAKVNELKEGKKGVDGIMNHLKKDEDGYYLSLSRPQSKTIRGKVVGFAPPIVFQRDGTTPLVDQLVGNGSDITSKVEYYTYNKARGTGGKGTAIRWFSTKVDNLIPFEMVKDFDDDYTKAAKGLDEAPPQAEF